jgi:hypothetical protein
LGVTATGGWGTYLILNTPRDCSNEAFLTGTAQLEKIRKHAATDFLHFCCGIISANAFFIRSLVPVKFSFDINIFLPVFKLQLCFDYW